MGIIKSHSKGDSMSLKKDYYQNLYISKVNIVQDYIEQHIGEYLTIEKLSSIVNFSPFYFHRLFKFITQESLYRYIKRLRLEKALFLLNSDQSITEIAISVGFSNLASFAKAFKKAYGVSASEFRHSKNGKQDNNNGQVTNKPSCYNKNALKLKLDELCTIEPCWIKVKNVETKKLIYLRHTGLYKGDLNLFSNLFQRLFKWAEARDLITPNSHWIVLYHDKGIFWGGDFATSEKLRISACLRVNHEIKIADNIGKYTLPRGKYAIGRFQLLSSEYQKAWDYMLFKWLPESGYKFDDRIPYEEYPHQKVDASNARQIVDIYIPISLV